MLLLKSEWPIFSSGLRSPLHGFGSECVRGNDLGQLTGLEDFFFQTDQVKARRTTTEGNDIALSNWFSTCGHYVSPSKRVPIERHGPEISIW